MEPDGRPPLQGRGEREERRGRVGRRRGKGESADRGESTRGGPDAKRGGRAFSSFSPPPFFLRHAPSDDPWRKDGASPVRRPARPARRPPAHPRPSISPRILPPSRSSFLSVHPPPGAPLSTPASLRRHRSKRYPPDLAGSTRPARTGARAPPRRLAPPPSPPESRPRVAGICWDDPPLPRRPPPRLPPSPRSARLAARAARGTLQRKRSGGRCRSNAPDDGAGVRPREPVHRRREPGAGQVQITSKTRAARAGGAGTSRGAAVWGGGDARRGRAKAAGDEVCRRRGHVADTRAASHETERLGSRPTEPIAAPRAPRRREPWRERPPRRGRARGGGARERAGRRRAAAKDTRTPRSANGIGRGDGSVDRCARSRCARPGLPPLPPAPSAPRPTRGARRPPERVCAADREACVTLESRWNRRGSPRRPIRERRGGDVASRRFLHPRARARERAGRATEPERAAAGGPDERGDGRGSAGRPIRRSRAATLGARAAESATARATHAAVRVRRPRVRPRGAPRRPPSGVFAGRGRARARSTSMRSCAVHAQAVGSPHAPLSAAGRRGIGRYRRRAAGGRGGGGPDVRAFARRGSVARRGGASTEAGDRGAKRRGGIWRAFFDARGRLARPNAPAAAARPPALRRRRQRRQKRTRHRRHRAGSPEETCIDVVFVVGDGRRPPRCPFLRRPSSRPAKTPRDRHVDPRPPSVRTCHPRRRRKVAGWRTVWEPSISSLPGRPGSSPRTSTPVSPASLCGLALHLSPAASPASLRRASGETRVRVRTAVESGAKEAGQAGRRSARQVGGQSRGGARSRGWGGGLPRLMRQRSARGRAGSHREARTGAASQSISCRQTLSATHPRRSTLETLGAFGRGGGRPRRRTATNEDDAASRAVRTPLFLSRSYPPRSLRCPLRRAPLLPLALASKFRPSSGSLPFSRPRSRVFSPPRFLPRLCLPFPFPYMGFNRHPVSLAQAACVRRSLRRLRPPPPPRLSPLASRGGTNAKGAAAVPLPAALASRLALDVPIPSSGTRVRADPIALLPSSPLVAARRLPHRTFAPFPPVWERSAHRCFGATFLRGSVDARYPLGAASDESGGVQSGPGAFSSPLPRSAPLVPRGGGWSGAALDAFFPPRAVLAGPRFAAGRARSSRGARIRLCVADSLPSVRGAFACAARLCARVAQRSPELPCDVRPGPRGYRGRLGRIRRPRCGSGFALGRVDRVFRSSEGQPALHVPRGAREAARTATAAARPPRLPPARPSGVLPTGAAADPRSAAGVGRGGARRVVSRARAGRSRGKRAAEERERLAAETSGKRGGVTRRRARRGEPGGGACVRGGTAPRGRSEREEGWGGGGRGGRGEDWEGGWGGERGRRGAGME